MNTNPSEESREAKEKKETFYGATPNWFGFSIGIIVFLVVSYFSTFLKPSGQWYPNAHELPLVLAPLISCSVAFAVFSDAYMHVRNDWRFSLLNAVCMLFTTLLGVALAVAHGWLLHILIMTLMFIVFIGWDMFVVKLSNAPEAFKNEVVAAHKSINLPTLGALAFLAVLLFYMYLCGMSTKTVEIDGLNVSVLDLVTTGAVAFHLGVASMAYICSVTPTGTLLIGKKGRIESSSNPPQPP